DLVIAVFIGLPPPMSEEFHRLLLPTPLRKTCHRTSSPVPSRNPPNIPQTPPYIPRPPSSALHARAHPAPASCTNARATCMNRPMRNSMSCKPANDESQTASDETSDKTSPTHKY